VFASGAGLLSADCPSRRASRFRKLASCPRWMASITLGDDDCHARRLRSFQADRN
jgi:hypothetical protein